MVLGVLVLSIFSCLLLCVVFYFVFFNFWGFGFSGFLFLGFLFSLFLSCWVLFHSFGFSFVFYWFGEESVIPLVLSFSFDFYSIIFMLLGTFVSWNILNFAEGYMSSDFRVSKFLSLLSGFLLVMILLVSSDGFSSLFLSWEGVGVISYLLISWWRSRVLALVGGLQALLYNGLATLGLVFSVGWLTWGCGSWFFVGSSLCFGFFLVGVGVFISSVGKSSQWGFHSWLPFAMEGPTPVSALLHSSTMVAAGSYLLIRFSEYYYSSLVFFYIFCIGLLTSFFAGLSSIFQWDMKKIVAYSTTSHLGFMFVGVGCGFSEISFFHLCCHSFFKALLFLCSGSFIHSCYENQDLRFFPGVGNILPVTGVCFLVGLVSLMGQPFLSGFYSKDFLLGGFLFGGGQGWFFGWGLVFLFILSVCFSFGYCLKLLYWVFVVKPFSGGVFIPFEDYSLVFPLIVLGVSSILGGLIFLGFFPFLGFLSLGYFLKLGGYWFSFFLISYWIMGFFKLSYGVGFLTVFFSRVWFFGEIFHVLGFWVSMFLSFLTRRCLDLGYLTYYFGKGGFFMELVSSGLFLKRGFVGDYKRNLQGFFFVLLISFFVLGLVIF
uniref:NADH-ubiquinone oxidoreductase chain 5 n=1 Tax=Rhabdopleura compacta TaxID=638968 RepID=F8J484_RHACM|nr:NADH dehydrogenase subunit 5 [Rhabdopleura compacta]